VCLLPFGSALLSHYYEDPLALRLFGLILIGTSVARTAIWASLAVYASGPVLYFIAITLLHLLAPRGSAERQFT